MGQKELLRPMFISPEISRAGCTILGKDTALWSEVHIQAQGTWLQYLKMTETVPWHPTGYQNTE